MTALLKALLAFVPSLVRAISQSARTPPPRKHALADSICVECGLDLREPDPGRLYARPCPGRGQAIH